MEGTLEDLRVMKQQERHQEEREGGGAVLDNFDPAPEVIEAVRRLNLPRVAKGIIYADMMHDALYCDDYMRD